MTEKQTENDSSWILTPRQPHWSPQDEERETERQRETETDRKLNEPAKADSTAAGKALRAIFRQALGLK